MFDNLYLNNSFERKEIRFFGKAKKSYIFAPVKSKHYLKNDPVVQLVRMPPCHGGGRGFESRPDRKRVF